MSLLDKYQRVLNTYEYSIQSSQGIDRDDGSGDGIGDFQILIPPFPYPTHQQSKVAIFTLQSFHFISQSATQYVSGGANGLPASSDYDISSFYVEVNGIGIRPQNYTSGKSLSLRGCKNFLVVNTIGGVHRASGGGAGSISEHVSAGGDCGVESICSNPVGSTLRIKVFSGDTGDLIADNANLDSIIRFKIELLPDDFQEREM